VRSLLGLRRRIGIGAFVSATLLAASAQPALAGAELKLGDDSSLNSVWVCVPALPRGQRGGRRHFQRQFQLVFGRELTVYMNGSFGKIIKATMNFDRTGGASAPGGMQMIDAIAQFRIYRRV